MLMSMYGFEPTQMWHLWALAVPAVIWLVFWPIARWRRSLLLHNASFVASFWEEAVFRGLLWGFVLQLGYSEWWALGATSAVFGLFHVRNLWWSRPGSVLKQCLYTGLVLAPILGLLRIWLGDIYIGIAVHALNNALAMYGRNRSNIPTDKHLLDHSRR